jgi:hypothetical protein
MAYGYAGKDIKTYEIALIPALLTSSKISQIKGIMVR